jgi:PKD repeat protein
LFGFARSRRSVWLAVWLVGALAVLGLYSRPAHALPYCTTTHYKPSARFTFSPPSPHAGQSVQFDGSSSTPGTWDDNCPSPGHGTDPTTYSWDFGDGAVASGLQPSHAYSGAGTYTVMLTATSTAGSSSVSHDVTVSPCPVVHQAPVAAFAYSPGSPQAGDSVQFDAGASAPGTWNDGCGASGTDTTTYTWDFGDGSTGSGVTATHAYAVAGTYQAVLTATSTGGSPTASQAVTVTAVPAGTTGGADTGASSTPPSDTQTTTTPAGTKCVVPKLIGKTVAGAKKLLAKAHCGVGKVARKTAKKKLRGRVISQRARAGTLKPAGSKVSFVVGR